jgi:hypothetical protein
MCAAIPRCGASMCQDKLVAWLRCASGCTTLTCGDQPTKCTEAEFRKYCRDKMGTTSAEPACVMM